MRMQLQVIVILSCNFVKTSKDDEAKLMVHADFCSKAKVVDVDFFQMCVDRWKAKGGLCVHPLYKKSSA